MYLGGIREIHPWLQPLPDKKDNTKDSEPSELVLMETLSESLKNL
jgi:hypothetical protein